VSSERGRTEFKHPQQDLLVTGLRHIGWSQFVDAKPHALQAHRHPGAFELCYIQRGRLRWWVDAQTFEVGPGDFFLTRPGELHGGEHGVMDPCELYWLAFTLDPAGGGLGLPAAEAATIDTALRASPRRTCRAPATAAGHYDRILATLRAPTPLATTLVRGTLALLLAEAVAAFAQAAGSVSPGPHYSPRTRNAIDWMQAHSASPLTIDQLAARVELRPSQFRKTFRDETGFTPQEFLTQLRLAEAKRLLAETSRSVTDIALATGFNSSAWFATAFRKQTGFSPRDWRQRQG
jgi:AraC-like DNA-binding protein